MISLCNNDPLLEMLRASFPSAHVLSRPSQRIQPLTALTVHGRLLRSPRVVVVGPFGELLSRERDLPAAQSAPSPKLTGKRSRRLEHAVGFSLLAGFLEGFGLNPELFSEQFKGTDGVTFSFDAVEEHWVDLGSRSLSGASLDTRSPATGPVRRGKADLAVVDRVFTSRGFTVELASSAQADFSLSLPVQEALAKVKVAVTVSGENSRTLQFTGETPLAFAFTAVIVELNQTGSVVGFVPPRQRLDFSSGDTDTLHSLLWDADIAAAFTDAPD